MYNRFASVSLKHGIFAALTVLYAMTAIGCLRRPARVAVMDAAQVLKNDWRFKQVEENKKFLPSSEGVQSPIPAFSKNFFLQFQQSISLQQNNTDNLYRQSLKAYFEQLQELQKQMGEQEALVLRQKLKEKQQEEIKKFDKQLVVLKEKYDERINGLKTNLEKQYERKKINLELKLKTLRISETEKTKTQKELEGLIGEMEIKEKEQRNNLLQEFENDKKKLDEGGGLSLAEFRQNLEKEAEDRLKALELKLKSKLMQKQAEHQAMTIESKGKQKTLLFSTRRFLTLLPEQLKTMPPNVYTATLQKQNEELIKTAFSEMNSLIKGIARAQKYDLILANVLATGTAIDITPDVKKKLSLTHE